MNKLFILLDSKPSTPNSTPNPLLSGRHEQLDLATPMQCDTLKDQNEDVFTIQQAVCHNKGPNTLLVCTYMHDVWLTQCHVI